jgi:hypothetical protein
VSEQRAPSGLVRGGATGIGRAGDDRGGLVGAGDPARHPAAVYLTRLGPGGRRTMRGALDTVARILRRGATAVTLPWHELRYEHGQAVRALLAERYAPATANKLLAALEGAPKEAWRPGLMDGEPFRTIDTFPPRGRRAGRDRKSPSGRVRRRPARPIRSGGGVTTAGRGGRARGRDSVCRARSR